MSHVFVSYSRQDSSFVDQLIKDLERHGVDVWLDREDIRGGDRWRPAIVEAIRSCEIFLLVLSPHAVASNNVSKELSLAETHQRRIIPLAYEKCEIPPALEYQLADVQWIDFANSSYDDTLPKLLQVLALPVESGKAPNRKLPLEKDLEYATKRFSLPLIALASVGVILAAVLAYQFFSKTDVQVIVTPTPTPTAAPPIASQTANRGEAVRWTIDGVNAFYAEDKSREAVVLYFNEAIKNDPTYAVAYFYRGQAFVALKKIELAIADFKKSMELELEADQRQAASDFLAGLQSPPLAPAPNPAAATPSPLASPVTGPTVRPGLTRPFPVVVYNRQPISRAETARQVSGMFSPEKAARIQATTKLIIEQKTNAEAVTLAIQTAQDQLNNKSGVINTLVYLESVPPEVLKTHRREVTSFLEAVRKTSPGPQTQEHLTKVSDALNKS